MSIDEQRTVRAFRELVREPVRRIIADYRVDRRQDLLVHSLEALLRDTVPRAVRDATRLAGLVVRGQPPKNILTDITHLKFPLRGVAELRATDRVD